MPYAVFTGAFGDNATGAWYAAHAEVRDGLITLWIAMPTGWAQLFSAPAAHVTVKSAAQRITLVSGGREYPILSDPRTVNRALGYNVVGTAANILDKPILGAGVDAGRGLTQVSAASAWNRQGGPEFIEAARHSGAQVSRFGYGPLIALGCGGGLFVVLAVTVITALVLA